VNLNFTQTISVRCDHPDALVQLSRDWDENQASAEIMGFMGSHILADRAHPGMYLLVAEFGVTDPAVPAIEEAMRNNGRPETQAWDKRLREIIIGEPTYHHYDEIYRTGWF
jgi:hypothetical protein